MTRRTVLVTGCSSGIGLALAKRFGERGWRVLAGIRDPHQPPADLLVDEIIPLDLADDDSISAAARRINRLDCLVNNAGYALVGPYPSYTSEQMRSQMQVNFLGPALLTQSLLPSLREAHGRIICISSLAGETGLPMNALYCASKFALEGWAESLAHELAAKNVQIALVEPGGHRTNFAANFRWGERATDADSIEHDQLAAYRAMLTRLLARPGKDPAAVVSAVLRLAEAKHLPLRSRIGRDALALHWLKAVLPEFWVQRLLAVAFRRQLSAPVSRTRHE